MKAVVSMVIYHGRILFTKKYLLLQIKNLELCFPLTQINTNWVAGFVDSEGNHIELTAPI